MAVHCHGWTQAGVEIWAQDNSQFIFSFIADGGSRQRLRQLQCDINQADNQIRPIEFIMQSDPEQFLKLKLSISAPQHSKHPPAEKRERSRKIQCLFF